ncbi:MAG: sodium:solute symporter [Sandaracinus sp.]|nr:sodium:solute symporter [Sandaracinus sp.]|tara:strand:- start:275 stop:1777 length:1503 start_codon:yes stop_codon:yes gene_type:complete
MTSGELTAWVAFGVYLVVTTALAVRGMKRTTSMKSFAVGGDMGPVLVGITLAASIASTATFVINPGFVWRSGLAALIHFGVAGTAGVFFGLVLLSRGFRRLGEKYQALTLPHWVGARFESKGMRTYFAGLNLILAVCFVVLIVKGSALVMQATLGLGYITSVIVVVGFVFSYILLGGTYAHAYTNALQGSIMLLVALALAASGLHLFADGGISGFFAALEAQDPNLTKVVNPGAESWLFDSTFEVFACGFIVSYGLVCQPHILLKALYLRSEKDLRRYLVVGAVVGVIFAAVLVVGLYARVAFPDADIAQDAVVPYYIANTFAGPAGALISVALLAAGMSTMDGILVSASTIAGNDLVLGLMKPMDEETSSKVALKASRLILVAMGAGSFALALNPPQLVGLFAQAGVYGLVAASAAPMTFGIFYARTPRAGAFAAAVVGPAVHFVLHLLLGVANPAVSATYGVLASTAVLAIACVIPGLEPAKSAVEAPEVTPESTPTA